jgi:hypothetical protein
MTRRRLLLAIGFGILYWLARQRYPAYTGSHFAQAKDGTARRSHCTDVAVSAEACNVCANMRPGPRAGVVAGSAACEQSHSAKDGGRL